MLLSRLVWREYMFAILWEADRSEAAALNMTEPCSTGIGGDIFCLFYKASDKKVYALNGSGRSGGKCTLETIRSDLGFKDGQNGATPLTGDGAVHSVTVPGAAAGWVDTIERFGSGKLSMSQILEPAIQLGEEGFPVSEIVARSVSLPCCAFSDLFPSTGLADVFALVGNIRSKDPQRLAQLCRDAEKGFIGQRRRSCSSSG